jgi:hypothetical protein
MDDILMMWVPIQEELMVQLAELDKELEIMTTENQMYENCYQIKAQVRAHTSGPRTMHHTYPLDHIMDTLSCLYPNQITKPPVC